MRPAPAARTRARGTVADSGGDARRERAARGDWARARTTAGTPTARTRRTARPRPAPADAPLSRSRADTRLAPPREPNRPRAPSTSRGERVLTCGKKQVYPCRIGSCSRRRNRTAPSFRSSVVSLLPPRQAGEAVTEVSALGFDTLASSVALANNYSDDSFSRRCLMCPFCCLH